VGDSRATQVNLAMVEAGWADTMTIAPNTAFADLYAAARVEAKAKGLGQWGSVGGVAAGAGAGQTTGAPAGSIGAGLPLASSALDNTRASVRLKCTLVNPSTPNDTG